MSNLTKIARLTPEQISRLTEQCLGTGPYKIVKVKSYGQNADVTVQFEDGTQKVITL